MSTKAGQSDVQKVTVTLPQPLLQRLNEYVPLRQRSHFIVAAIEERLAIEEQLEAIEESAGAWLDEHHPEMKTEEDIDSWLHQLRHAWPLAVSNGHE